MRVSHCESHGSKLARASGRQVRRHVHEHRMLNALLALNSIGADYVDTLIR
jgi:hypothetical protein